jgi:subtilase family serine protease
VGMRSWGYRWISPLGAIIAIGALAPLASAAPSGAVEQLGSAPPAQGLHLVLPLRANLAGLERFATEVTTPGSPLYGDYQPISVLARRFGATTADRGRVVSFLHRQGASHVRVDATGLFADATLNVSRAEHLFGAALARYQSVRAGRYVAPKTPALVPAALRGSVTGVVGLNTQPLVAGQNLSASSAARFPHSPQVTTDSNPSGYGERTGTAVGCSGALQDRGFTPNEYLDAYGYSPLHAAGINGQGERVALIEIDGFRYSDLKSFAQCFGLPVPAINGYGVNISHPLPAVGETTLDLQVIDAAAPGLSAVDVYESRSRPSDVLQSLTAPLQNPGRVPEVISASLGACEPATQLAIGRSGIRSAEGALALAAASGISVLASSGDTGSSSCIVAGSPVHALATNYPASSPFVTSVGGTNFVLNAANQIQSQTAWNDTPYDLAAGGGGTSALFRRPGYQNGFFRRPRRAVPDVSMLADELPGYNIFCSIKACTGFGQGPWIAVGGTSAASPLLAGGLALVDQLARQNGRQEIGLANSLFYRIARHYGSSGVFSDVRSGSNDLGPSIPGGNHRRLGCCTAGPGYDRASGLGSVDLSRLALLALRLQPPVASAGISMPAQRPLARRHLVARLSCSRRCNARAVATIALPGGKTINVGSPRQLFLRRGRRKVLLRLSKSQVRRIRGAIHGGHAVSAQVTGEVLDSGGNVEGRTRPDVIRIRH